MLESHWNILLGIQSLFLSFTLAEDIQGCWLCWRTQTAGLEFAAGAAEAKASQTNNLKEFD